MCKKLKWLIVVFMLVSIVGFGEQITKVNILNERIEELSCEKEEAVAETAILKKNIIDLNDLACIEIQARQRLSMIYPAEKLYIEAVAASEAKEKTAENLEILD